MKIRIRWLILSAIVVVLIVGCIIFNLSAQNSSNVLSDSNIRTGMQNFSVAYDSSKKITIVGTYSNSLLAYNEKGEQLWSFATKGPVREIKVSEENRKAYIGCEDRNVYIIDIDKGTQLGIVKVQRRIYSIDINKDASMIAVSAGVSPIKHGLYIYDNSGKEIWKKDIGSISRKISFNSDYSKIFLVTDRAELMVFDLEGKQINTKKFDYSIADIFVDRESSLLSILTVKSTFFLINENLKQISSGSYAGEGVSIGASKNSEWIGIGTAEGRFYIVDRLGKIVFQTFINNTITDVLLNSDKAYMTGLGSFMYSIDMEKLNAIRVVNAIKLFTKTLIYLLPILLVVFLILSFKRLSSIVSILFKTIIRHRVAYLMLVPTFTLLIIFAFIPVIRAFIMAFTDWSIVNSNALTIKFIGFDNFKLMLSEGYFFIGMKNLLIIVTITFVKILTVPLLVGELVFLMKGDRKKYWFRFLFVLPMVVPVVVSTLVWQNIYDPNVGLLNNLLHSFNLDSLIHVWLGDPKTAIWSIVGMGFPYIDAFAFLVFYGGLISIPGELFEAAKVDGSNGWWNFTRIHLPLITPQIKMLVILSFIGSVQNFTPILLLTKGGPGIATYVPGLELYNNATAYGRYGYACALGLVLFAAIFVGTIRNTKIKTASDNEL
jgi:ABC-type sugar transport system permease subunit